jgi:ribosomal protein S12 methylthiotransferase
LKALGADYKHELLGERLTTTPKNYAYLKISEGCDRPCSFCAIPLMRGKNVSQTIEKLVKESEGLAKNGVKD